MPEGRFHHLLPAVQVTILQTAVHRFQLFPVLFFRFPVVSAQKIKSIPVT
jgi:hypothetical protein